MKPLQLIFSFSLVLLTTLHGWSAHAQVTGENAKVTIVIEPGAPGKASLVQFRFWRDLNITTDERLLVTAVNLAGLGRNNSAEPVKKAGNRSGQLAGWYETSDNSQEFWVGQKLGAGSERAEISLMVQSLLTRDPDNENVFRLLFVPVKTDLFAIAQDSHIISFATITKVLVRIPSNYTILESKVKKWADKGVVGDKRIYEASLNAKDTSARVLVLKVVKNPITDWMDQKLAVFFGMFFTTLGIAAVLVSHMIHGLLWKPFNCRLVVGAGLVGAVGIAVLMSGGERVGFGSAMFDGAGAIGSAVALVLIMFMPVRTLPALLGFLASLRNPETAAVPQPATGASSGGSGGDVGC